MPMFLDLDTSDHSPLLDRLRYRVTDMYLVQLHTAD